ncbi:helicase protein MOM1-like [Bidens hawaiensis]|uniref:helicase protein MOM1-like n=1 Tax=Bidens hawaiensis TaxID=980011 RepID=UPI00404B873E
MFNKAESERFVCLCEYRACCSSIRLSRVDVVVLFNSGRNPLYDINALQRITIDSHCGRLHVFRLYSAFTVEEKALILSKQGTPVDSYISWRVCQQLLGWGASYLFSNLQSCTDSVPKSFIDDLVHELSPLLRKASVETGPTNHLIISNAPMQNGAYSECIKLFGETETHTKESASIDEYLFDNEHYVFWNNLVKESQPGPEKPCSRLSWRVPKPTRNWFEYENAVRSKPRSKRKLVKNVGRKWGGACLTATPSIVLNPGTHGGQQSQTDQPPPHTVEAEIERIQKEREQIAKSHKEKESMLLAELEKEISEIRKKYDGLIHDSKTCSTDEDMILKEYEKLVNANKLLAEILSQNWQDTPILKKAQKETSTLKILQIPASALVGPRSPCSTSGLTTYLPGLSLSGSGVRFPATGEPSLEPLPPMSYI